MWLYTVGHKNGATLIPTITLAILKQVLGFFAPVKNRNKYSRGEFKNLRLHHKCVATLPDNDYIKKQLNQHILLSVATLPDNDYIKK